MHNRFVFFRLSSAGRPGDTPTFASIVLAYLDVLGRHASEDRPIGRIVRELSPDFCLVELSARGAGLMIANRPAIAAELRDRFPGIGYSEERQYRPASVPSRRKIRPTEGGSRRKKQFLSLRIVDQELRPIPEALVKAFEDFHRQRGAQARTDSRGQVDLPLGSPTVRLQHLSVQLA